MIPYSRIVATSQQPACPSELDGAILATARPKSLLINMSGVSIDIGSAVEGSAAFVKLETGHCCNMLGRASNPRGLARVKLSGSDAAAGSGGGGGSWLKADFSEGIGTGGWSGAFEVLSAGDVYVPSPYIYL